MKTSTTGDTLIVSDLDRLTALNATHFKELVHGQMQPSHQCVRVDCSAMSMLDSAGIGALISVHKTLRERQGKLVLAAPTQIVDQVVRLLKLDTIFEVTPIK